MTDPVKLEEKNFGKNKNILDELHKYMMIQIKSKLNLLTTTQQRFEINIYTSKKTIK